MSRMYTYVSFMYTGFHLLPLFFTLLREKNLLAAIWEPIKQLLMLSPLYYSLQGKCVGQTLAREISEGGGDYVATGRGISVKHEPFHKLYVNCETRLAEGIANRRVPDASAEVPSSYALLPARALC